MAENDNETLGEFIESIKNLGLSTDQITELIVKKLDDKNKKELKELDDKNKKELKELDDKFKLAMESLKRAKVKVILLLLLLLLLYIYIKFNLLI